MSPCAWILSFSPRPNHIKQLPERYSSNFVHCHTRPLVKCSSFDAQEPAAIQLYPFPFFCFHLDGEREERVARIWLHPKGLLDPSATMRQRAMLGDLLS